MSRLQQVQQSVNDTLDNHKHIYFLRVPSFLPPQVVKATKKLIMIVDGGGADGDDDREGVFLDDSVALITMSTRRISSAPIDCMSRIIFYVFNYSIMGGV
jgi:hypothetical protein